MLKSFAAALTGFAAMLVLTGCTMFGGESSITHGPMLGRLSHDGVSVWARTHRPADFTVRYRPAAGGAWAESQPVTTQRAHDHTGVVQLSGLEPDTEYAYVVVDGRGAAGPGGTFRTLPDRSRLIDEKHNPAGLFNFAFEFACGNNQNPKSSLGPTLPTYDTLLRDVRGRVDFAILNGDWLYEDARDYGARAWRGQVGLVDKEPSPRVVDLAPTITGVWENYKRYLSRGRNLSEWHRHVPSYYTFDDHEIVNDVFATAEAGYVNRRTVFRDIAVQAWFDYLGWANPTATSQPVHFGRAAFTKGSDVLVDKSADFTAIDMAQAGNLHVHWGTPDAGVMDTVRGAKGDTEGGNPNAGVYDIVKVIDKHRVQINPPARADGQGAAYSIGRRSYGSFRVANCEFFLLDTRSHRDLHDLKTPMKPGRSIVGQRQLRWLMDGMKASDADFMFVVSSVNFMIPHVGGGGHHFDAKLKDDAWTAFLDEREKLIDFWDSLGRRVFVLTGDLHNSFAVKITDRVWEFASGPHNSVNHRPVDEGDRPVNGPFKHGPRECEIRWSSIALGDIPRENRMFPHYCVVQINNVFNNPLQRGGQRYVAYPVPHVIFQYYDGLTGELRYAETVHASQRDARTRGSSSP